MLNSFLGQVIIVIIVFNLVAFYRESAMLELDEKVDKKVDKTGEKKELQLPSITGDTVKLLAPEQGTVLYFFAPWCQVCDFSIGNLQALHQEQTKALFPDKNSSVNNTTAKLNIIAVALDYHNKQEIEHFAREHQLTMPVLLGNSSTKKQFNISAYPSYYVIDKNQKVVARSMGYSSELGLYLRTLAL